jgi:D-alanine-D-alanine ligase
MKTRIGIIFGGRSGEHEISIRSAKTVIEQIDKDKYEVVPIAISREGNWLNPSESLQLLPAGIRENLNKSVENFSLSAIALVGDTKYKGLTNMENGGKSAPLDVVFPVLHGTFGEDGTIQGLLEMADIPYVGQGFYEISVPRFGVADVQIRLVFAKRMGTQRRCGYQTNRRQTRISVFR